MGVREETVVKEKIMTPSLSGGRGSGGGLGRRSCCGWGWVGYMWGASHHFPLAHSQGRRRRQREKRVRGRVDENRLSRCAKLVYCRILK